MPPFGSINPFRVRLLSVVPPGKILLNYFLVSSYQTTRWKHKSCAALPLAGKSLITMELFFLKIKMSQFNFFLVDIFNFFFFLGIKLYVFSYYICIHCYNSFAPIRILKSLVSSRRDHAGSL